MNLPLKDQKALASFGLLGATVIWGFSFIVVKSSLDLIPVFYQMALRFTLAAVILGLLFYRRMKVMTKQVLFQGLVLGIFLFLSYVFQTIGILYTTAGKNAFLTASYVIMVPFLHWLFNHKKPDHYSVVAAVLGLIGIGCISLQNDLSVNLGDLLTLICGLMFAMHIIFIERYTKYSDPIVLTVLQLGFSGLFSWIAAPFFHGGMPASALNGQAVLSILYLGIFATMIGFLLQNVGQKYTSPSTASLLLSFEAVFGMLFSVLFYRESVSGRMIFGCVILFFAIILSETKLSFFGAKTS